MHSTEFPAVITQDDTTMLNFSLNVPAQIAMTRLALEAQAKAEYPWLWAHPGAGYSEQYAGPTMSEREEGFLSAVIERVTLLTVLAPERRADIVRQVVEAVRDRPLADMWLFELRAAFDWLVERYGNEPVTSADGIGGKPIALGRN